MNSSQSASGESSPNGGREVPATAYEKELYESRAQLEIALKAGLMGSWMLDLDAGALTSSETCRRNFGRSPGEPFTYQDLAESIHPDDRQYWTDQVGEAIAKCSEFEIAYRTIWPDGSLHWIAVRGNCFPDETGKTSTLAGVTVDITDRKLTEEKLEETSRLNQDVIDSLAAHIAVLDNEGVITAVNKAWRQFALENGADWTMKGLGVGANYLEVCRTTHGPEEAEARLIYQGIKDVLDDRQSIFTMEYPCHSPTQQRWFMLSVSQLGKTRGGAVVSHTNITERRLAEEAARRYQERFEIVKDGAEIGFWFCDLPFDELIWDQRVKEHFWFPPDERITIDKFYDRLHPDDRERTRNSIEASIAKKTGYDIEYRTVGPQGEIKWIRAIGRTFYNDGRPARFDGVTLDITTQKRAEAALRERELLESAVKLQEAERRRIARDLHDQLGQQLTGLRLKLADLLAGSAEKPELREKIEKVQETARAIDRDVSSLAFELRANMPSKEGLADALGNFVAEWSQNYGIKAEFHVSGPASNGRFPDAVETNLYRIAQEALNNTTKHSNASRVDVILDVREDQVRLIVEDDGAGFDIKATAKATPKNGHGLGLVGMQERADLLSGTLELDSTPGSGTTVYVTVPLSEMPT